MSEKDDKILEYRNYTIDKQKCQINVPTIIDEIVKT